MPDTARHGRSYAGAITVGSLTVTDEIAGSVFAISTPTTASSVDDFVYVADRAVEVVAIREIHSVVGGASAAVRFRKITAVAAPGATAGATVVELAQSFDLTTTVNTVVAGTLVTAAVTLAAGDKIARDFSGTLTNLVGNTTVTLRTL